MTKRCKDCGHEGSYEDFKVPDDEEYDICPECQSEEIEELD